GEAAAQTFRANVRYRGLTSGGQRMQRGDRRGVVDHTLECLGKYDQLAQPADGAIFELRGGRAREGERGEEAGMVPMRQTRDDDLFEVSEDRFEVFTVIRGRRRKGVLDRAR